MKFLHVKPWNLTIGAPPKCGSSSIYDALQREFGVDDLRYCDDVALLKRELVSGPLVFIVRCPLARFKSLWRNKCRDGGRLDGHDVKGKTPEELFDYILTHYNHHWTPQRELLGTLDAELVALDSLAMWWSWHISFLLLGAYDAPLNELNETWGGVPMSDELKRHVLEYYADDLVLHALARDV